MERIKEIIKELGFKEGSKDFYYKFVTPDSIVTVLFEADYVTIAFKAHCGTRNEELAKVEESYKMYKTRINESSKDGLKFFIKGEILRLAMSVHRKYLFNE